MAWLGAWTLNTHVVDYEVRMLLFFMIILTIDPQVVKLEFGQSQSSFDVQLYKLAFNVRPATVGMPSTVMILFLFRLKRSST